MDKREFKEKIENIPTETSENYPHYEVVNKEKVLNLFVELDEPEKVVLPEFVSKFLLYHKDLYMQSVFEDAKNYYPEVYKWLDEKENERIFIIAWQRGEWEVEQFDKLSEAIRDKESEETK